MADNISFNHDAISDIIDDLRQHICDHVSSMKNTSHDATGVDSLLVDAIRHDDEDTLHTLDGLSDTTSTLEDANTTVSEVGDVSGRDIDSTTIGEPIETHTSAAVLGTPGVYDGSDAPTPSPQASQQAQQVSQMHQAQQAMMFQQQQQQQMMTQQAQQAAWQQHVAAVRSFNQHQAQAWQQAMANRQAAINQLNAQAQAQAAKQTAISPSIGRKEIEEIIDSLYADEENHIDSGKHASSLPVSDVDQLSVGDVSFEKYPSSQLSDDEVRDIINQACDLNGISDDPQVRAKFENVFMHVALNESGLNPNAANGWDSNAVGETQSDGFPAQSSRGIWQTIPATFASNHVAGTSTSIYDPLASCAAAMRYTMNSYGVDTSGGGLDEFGAKRGIDASSGETNGSYMGY